MCGHVINTPNNLGAELVTKLSSGVNELTEQIEDLVDGEKNNTEEEKTEETPNAP